MPENNDDFLIAEQKPQSKHMLRWVIFSVIFLAVVGIAIWLALGGAPSAAPQNTDETKEEKNFDYTGWQNYRNEEFGYELKYPADAVLVSNPTETVVRLRGAETMFGGTVSVIVLQPREGKSGMDLAVARVMAKPEDAPWIKWESINFAGQEAQAAYYIPPSNAGGSAQMIVFSRNGTDYLVTKATFDKPTEHTLAELADAISASFNFYDR